MDIGGHVVLVVSLHELNTLKETLNVVANLDTSQMPDVPVNRPLLWQVRRATELLKQFPVPFKCEAFVMAGPGHQSRHTCEREDEHPIEGEHSDLNTEWTGTAYYEVVEQPWKFTNSGPEDINLDPGNEWTSVSGVKWRRPFDGGWEYQESPKRKLVNVAHRNPNCGHGW